MSGSLYVIGTPIGNLEDASARALRILSEVDLIVAEDTRVTAKLLARHGIVTKLKSYREQNARRVVPEIVARIRSGDAVALVSDAGTPSVSDPGLELVDAALAQGVNVTPIPGPSALASIVSICGLGGDGVRFWGFLPRSGKRRASKLASLESEPALVVFYESPHRLRATLEELAGICPERRACVARELTKIHEQIVRAPLGELAEQFDGKVLGEISVAIEGLVDDAQEDEVLSDEDVTAIVRAELDKGKSTKELSAELARRLGLPKKRIYSLALELLKGEPRS